MPRINTVVFGGHMVADPLFTPANADGTPDSKDRAWVVIAHNPPTKREDVKPVFMPCVAWGNNAHIMAKNGSKGKEWMVEGSLKTRTKQRSDGSKENYVEITVMRHHMGNDSKEKRQRDAEAKAAANTPAQDKPMEQKPPQQESVADSDKLKQIMAYLAESGVSPQDIAAALGSTPQSTDVDTPFD